MQRQSSVLALMALGVALAVPGYAQSDPEDMIKYRKSFMKTLGGHVSAAALIMRGKVDYMPHLLDHARALAAAGPHLHDVFPEDSERGDTDALPAVWERPQAFKQAVDETDQAASAFLDAVESGDQDQMGARFKALGRSCKGCHVDFRKEQK